MVCSGFLMLQSNGVRLCKSFAESDATSAGKVVCAINGVLLDN